ncbi:MAG: membrane protein insertase YidC [bacterium]
MDKKFLFSLLLALLTVGVFHYFYGKKQATDARAGMVAVGQIPVKPGEPIKVPTTEQLHKPLNTDVSFVEQKISQQEEIIRIETDNVVATFSTFGAILNTVDYKKYLGRNKTPLRTVYAQSGVDEEQRKKGCFLLALGEKTPYFYKHLYTKTQDNKFIVAFQTESPEWDIRKIYTLSSGSYQIDLVLEFEPKVGPLVGAVTSLVSGKIEGAAIQPRLFFMSPFIPELGNDAITAFMYSESSDTVEQKEVTAVHGYAWYWERRDNVVFGAQDRYFAHALIRDNGYFVQRGYYKKISDTSLFSVLEGPQVTEKKSWSMSFYIGPKVYDQLNQAHNRISDILSFGWLSWFCKMMLKLLEFLYQYLHNFGLAIIALTILLRLPFVPLSIYSRKKMEDYQKHQPFITHIRMKYKSDVKMQQEEIMRYHRDHNLSPATPMIGCLPLLIQLPILFSLYRVLGSYLDLYQAPFFGWIVDLSAKDPFYVLPVLMGVSMIWQQSMTPAADDKQKVIMWFMAVVMTAVFSSFAAGLVLYWFLNNVLTIAEDYFRKAFLS